MEMVLGTLVYVILVIIAIVIIIFLLNYLFQLFFVIPVAADYSTDFLYDKEILLPMSYIWVVVSRTSSTYDTMITRNPVSA